MRCLTSVPCGKAKGLLAAALSVILAFSTVPFSSMAYAEETTNVNTDTTAATIIPTSAVSVSGKMTAAAYRAAQSAVEILGLSNVEQASNFVNTAEWYNWMYPEFYLIASGYNSNPSPYLANLATGLGTNASTSTYDIARTGTGSGPNQALAAYAEGDEDEDDIWLLDPAIVVGVGDAGSTYDWNTEANMTSVYSGKGRGNWHAVGVCYDIGARGSNGEIRTWKALVNDMQDIADAYSYASTLNNTTNTARYIETDSEGNVTGTPAQIAQEYEQYVYGTIGYVAKSIANGRARREVCLVEDVRTNASGNYEYRLVTQDEALNANDGTASVNRFLEATCYTGIDGAQLAVNYADRAFPGASTVWVPAANLNTSTVALIMVGGQASSSRFADIKSALAADNLLYKSYYTYNNNSAAGSLYGTVMNSVDCAQNLGRILGMLYGSIINEQSWTAYYYKHMYHINDAYLVDVMKNALNNNVRNANKWSVSQAEEAYFDWSDLTSAWAESNPESTVESKLAEGVAYLKSIGSI